MAKSLIKSALECSNLFYDPESYLGHRFFGTKIADAYQKSPTLSRVAFGTLATIRGFVKTILIPLIAVVAFVAMPIIATVKGLQGRGREAGAWLLAWSFTILAMGAVAAYITVTAFHMPLVASSVIFWAAVAASITVHVFRAMKAPSSFQEPLRPLSLRPDFK